MLMAIAFAALTDMFSMMQILYCGFNFTLALAVTSCLLQTIAALCGAMVWFGALFGFNDEFNPLCGTPMEGLIRLSYGVSWQLSLAVFYISWLSVLVIVDTVNWQRLLSSLGTRPDECPGHLYGLARLVKNWMAKKPDASGKWP